MKSFAWALAAAVLAFQACAGPAAAQETKHPDAARRVVVKAEVPKEMGQAGARAEAIREACWRVVGGLVMSSTLVRLSKLEQDDIRTKTQGFAKEIRVIQSGAQGEMWVHEAEFEVMAAPTAKILKEMGLLRDWRIMVVIPEQIIRRPVPDPAAETEFINQFVKAGFKVIDQARSAVLRQGDVARLKDPNIAAELARKMGADILITGEAFAEEAPEVMGMQSCRARVEIRAILAETAEIVSADAKTAGGADITVAIAGKTALQNTARLLAPQFVDDIMLIPGGNSRKLKLQVGVFKGFTDADDFEEALKKLPGVDRVNREDYTEGLATFEVEIQAELHKTLPRLLEKDPSMVPFSLKVKSWSVTGGRADVQ